MQLLPRMKANHIFQDKGGRSDLPLFALMDKGYIYPLSLKKVVSETFNRRTKIHHFRHD